jgi:ubiquinone/menaquinone biosynthesis C-methylase UbiE
VRHLRGVLAANAEVYGTDYNPESIAWCSEHIPDVRFATNGLNPPLSFPNDFFDFVYAISVFTHLSEDVCRAWMDELTRVLKPGGLVYFSTKSDGNARFLLPDEQKNYREKGVVVRGLVEEGKKMFGAWHHPDYVKKILLAKYELLEQRTPPADQEGQDFWLARNTTPAGS